jgi:hypothetical protein
MQTRDGSDTATVRNTGLKGNQVTVKVQEEQSRDKEQDHTSEVIGYMVIWDTRNVNRTQIKDQEPVKTQPKLHSMRRFPLTDAKIYVKTTKFNKSPVDNFAKMLATLKNKSPKGYCKKYVSSMHKVGNRALCNKGRLRHARKNIGF